MANKIAIEIVVDDKGTAVLKQFSENAQNKLRGAGDAAKTTDSAFSGMVGTLKNMIGIAAAAFGVHQITSYAKEAVMLAARVETLGVVLGVVGENAGYSRGEMAKYVEEVRRMGITTEVAHDAVIKIAQAQINVADSAKLARVAQDAAVIGNINSSEAFQRMINGIRSGEVEILKTIGLNVQFEQGYQRMAQQLGKSVDSLTNQEKAQARSNLVMEAGTRIAGAYEASMGTAGKMMLSMARFTEELKLGFGQLFSGALTDAVFGITGYLKDMNKYMEQMRDSGALSDVTDMVTTGLKTAWISVKDVIIAVWNALRPLGPMISDMLPILGLVASGWGYIRAALKPVGVIIGEIITSVFNLGKLVGSAFGALSAALTGDFATAKAYATQLDQTWAALGKSATNAYAAVTDGVAAAIIAHENEAAAAVTTSKQKTAAQLADEERLSKAKADAAKAAIAQAQKVAAEQSAEAKKAAEAAKKIDQEVYDNWKKIIKSQLDEQERADNEREAALKKYAGLVEGTSKEIITSYIKAGDEAVEQMEREIAEGVELSKNTLDRIESRRQAERDLYKDLQGYDNQYYEASVALLQAQAEKYRALGIDNAAVAAWVAAETIQLEIKKGKASQDFVDGVKAGLLEMQRAQTTWGTVGYNIISTFASGATKQLSDNFFNILKGNWDQVKFDFGSLMDSLLQILTNKIAEMIVQWGIYQAAVYAASAFGFQVPGGITNPFAAATTNPLGTAGAAYSAYAALAGGTTAAGAAGFTAAEIGLATSGASFTGGVGGAAAGGGAASGAGLGALGTVGIAAATVAAPFAVMKLFEGIMGEQSWTPNADKFTPAAYAQNNLINEEIRLAMSGGDENWLTPSQTRDFWKQEYIDWYRVMHDYFGQTIPMTISANDAWLQSPYYLHGGYPARSGLDYVPYDNFPIRAHQGEAVLTRRDAQEWRGESRGGGGEAIHVHLHIDGKEVTDTVVRGIRSGDDDLIKYLRRAVN